MPSPHPTNRPGNPGPTPKQLTLLRQLARTCGQTFATPRTTREASTEINRLLAVYRDTPLEQLRAERTAEPERLQDTTSPYRAAEFGEDEITGYGADAHWTHPHNDGEGGS
jgi:hypothetical protein